MQLLMEKLSNYWQLRFLAVSAGVILIVCAVMMPVHSIPSAVGAMMSAATGNQTASAPTKTGNHASEALIGTATAGDQRVVSATASAKTDGPWLEANQAAVDQLKMTAAWFGEDKLPRDYSDAVKPLRSGAEKGSVTADFLLGRFYELGLGVPKNISETARLYARAEEASTSGIGNSAGEDSEAGPLNLTQALERNQRAAEAGDATAEFYVGVQNDLGIDMPKNRVEAVRWYRLAASQGSFSAANNLGVLLHEGYGPAPDNAAAAHWFAIAAEHGIASAQYSLGRMYFDGEGVARDSARAADWLGKAARQGNAPAEVLLSLMYATGDGVKGDTARAYMWINLASVTEASARVARDVVGSEISSTELADGQRLTHEWLSQRLSPARD